MIDKCKVLAVTLARGGSKSVPRKNIADLCGHPLIYYTIREVKKSQYIDRYVVSTEDAEIKQVCLNEGVEVVDRPIELSTDRSSSADALLHTVSVCDGYEYIVEAMATNPFKTANDIDLCIQMLHEKNAESVVSVVQVEDHHPARVKYLVDGVMKDFYPETPESRRQDLIPSAYVRNGSIYAMRSSFLEREKSRYNKKTYAYVMPAERSVNIDSSVDLKLSHILMSERGCHV